MRVLRKRDTGFSLIELLAAIFIISLVLGVGLYFGISIINSSNEKTQKIAYENIKTSARVFVEENFKDIVWERQAETETTCVPLIYLMSKGYIKNEVIEDIDYSSVIVTKDVFSKNIIKEELDTTNQCGAGKVATIPTNKYCLNTVYNGKSQSLIDLTKVTNGYTFIDSVKVDAGEYKVKAKLNEDYIWNDGTDGEKEITCSMKKANINLLLYPDRNDSKIGTTTTVLTTNVPGTIRIQSSNDKYVKASVDNNTIEKEKEILIDVLSSREKDTYITLTVIPNTQYKNNYKESSVQYTVGDITKNIIDVPTDSYCNSLTYNGAEQILTSVSKNDGYFFVDNVGLDAGEYVVTANLIYGYRWNIENVEEQLTPKTITCNIGKLINYHGNGAKETDVKVQKCTNSNCLAIENSFTRTGYEFANWNTNASGNGTSIKVGDSLKNISGNMINLYAQWSEKKYNITLNSNGATTAGTGTIYEKYNTGIYLDSALTKKMTTSANAITKPARVYTITYNINSTGATSSATTGTVNYTYNGYYTSASSGTQLINENGYITSSFVTNYFINDATLYAQWTAGSTTLATITKPGNTCKWNTASDGSGTSYTSGKTGYTTSSNVTLYARCTPIQYNVNYYMGNGKSTAGATKFSKTTTCTYGQPCTLESFSSLGGTFPNSSGSSSSNTWSFYGWSTSETVPTRTYKNSDSITLERTTDLDLYAVGRKTFYFNTGKAPTTVASTSTLYQYWNPYSTDAAYLTSIVVPKQTDINTWTFIGYLAGDSTASSNVTYGADKVGKEIKPAYNAYPYIRSVYQRTLTLNYNSNGGSGTVSNQTATQYYNSGYASGGSNNGANVSTPTFTLRANSFTNTGHTFNKWADGSTSGTEYAAGASYNKFSPAVDNTTVTKTMYAKWTPIQYKVNYYIGNGTSTAGATKFSKTTTCTYGKSCTLESFSSLGGTFPSSSASDSRYTWSFYGWSTSETGPTRTYANNASITLERTTDLNLYAVGRKPFYFNTGKAPTTVASTLYQYWNPYSTSYVSSITIPTQTGISGWTFIGYVAASNTASSNVTYSADKVGTEVKPAYNAYPYIRSVYQRTLTLNYNSNGGSGTVSNQTATQYYNSGYASGGSNNGANVSTTTFTLRANSFTNTGHTFTKWADGSTSGTQYAASASYTFSPAVDNTTVTKTMYALWRINRIRVTYNVNGGTVTSSDTKYTQDSSGNVLVSGSTTGSAYDYGATDINLADYNNSQYLKITKTGYSGKSQAEWNTKADGTGTSFNQNPGTGDVNANDLCDASTSDCHITLYVNWTINRVTFKFNVNGGTIREATSDSNGSYKWDVDSSGFIKRSKDGGVSFTTAYWKKDYNATSVNLPDYDNTNYMYISKNGIPAKSGLEWNTKADGSGTSFSDDSTYKASDFCDATNGNCTVNLYVNWSKIMYLCVSDSSSGYTAGGTTYMREIPDYGSDVHGHVIITGTPVTILGSTGTFYYVETIEGYRSNITYNKYYSTAQTDGTKERGYIRKLCLLPNPISSSNYCTPTDCPG